MLLAAFAPLLSDGPIIALCLLVLTQIPTSFQRILYVVGGSFILYLAHGAYRSWKNFDPNLTAPEIRPQQNLLKAALINTLSPGPYMFWSLVTGPILVAGWREIPANGIAFMFGFYITFILSLMLIIFIFSAMQSLGQKVTRALVGISAVALSGFGLYQLWLGLR